MIIIKWNINFIAIITNITISKLTKILKTLSHDSNCVIATGGGVVERAENKKIIRSGGTVVFIDRSPEDIFSDIDTTTRPLLSANGQKHILTLYEKRYPKYTDYCHKRNKNNSTLEVLTEKIINEVNQLND